MDEPRRSGSGLTAADFERGQAPKQVTRRCEGHVPLGLEALCPQSIDPFDSGGHLGEQPGLALPRVSRDEGHGGPLASPRVRGETQDR